MFRYFVDVARALSDLYNYSSTCSIVTGLDIHAIKRKNLTLDAVGKQYLEYHAGLRSIFSEANRYKNYRDATRDMPKGIPFIPHLAIHLSDLTFMEV